MTLVRRILILAAISISGIALLAPLAARSAAPELSPIPESLLLDIAAPATGLERGTMSARGGVLSAVPATGAEEIHTDAPPTPGSAPMEATLHNVATPPPTPTPAPAAPAPAPRRVVTYDGDTVWDRLAKCESGGNWAINTGNGYYGGLQFSHPTWHGYGGGDFAEYPHQATRAEQIIVAKRLHDARGFQPWPACRIKLGLP
jgi:hypothetical protein